MNDAQATILINAKMGVDGIKSGVDQIQKYLNGLNLGKLGDSFSKEFAKFNKEYNKYQDKINGGLKSQSDYSGANKSLNGMINSYKKIASLVDKLSHSQKIELFGSDSKIKEYEKTINSIQKKMNSLKFPDTLNNILGQVKGNISAKNKEIPNLIAQIQDANKAGNFDVVSGGIDKLIGKLNLSKNAWEQQVKIQTEAQQKAAQGSVKYDEAGRKIDSYKDKIKNLNSIIEQLKNASPEQLPELIKQLEQAQKLMEGRGKELGSGFDKFNKKVQESESEVESLGETISRTMREDYGANRQIAMIDQQIARYFTLGQMIRKVADIARQAWATVKELDASMTQTAVVTNFDVSDMWEMLPTYTARANELGSTIKDVYDATTLYYQQGLNTSQAMGVAVETLKMARIGGLEAAEATDMMTAALRGFNMQINELSAQRINDVYSKLAAITASNTEELGSAMTRTASIAHSAGMEFETTSAFLAQMIETTREAPENLGTAMKTIVARFQEMKKSPEELVDSEGELLDANRVEKALKTVGIALRNTNGDFRNLDQVFLEISAKWDSLSMGQQRYIATMAAGSRQQSRFIAMMSNHERVMELVDAANNSAGASAEQFGKTLESMDAKLNKFHNAWNQFAMGMLNSDFSKGLVDAGTKVLDIINKVITVFSKIPPSPFEGITKSLLTLGAAAGAMKLGGKGFDLIRIPMAKYVRGLMGHDDEDLGRRYNTSDMLGEIGGNAKGAFQKAIPHGEEFGSGIAQGILNQKVKVQQSIENILTNNKTGTNPVEALLNQTNFSLEEKGEKVLSTLRNSIANDKSLPEEMRHKAEVALHSFEQKLSEGKVNPEYIKRFTAGFTKNFGQNLDELDYFQDKVTGIGRAFTASGYQLQRFGNTLKGTPFEFVGNILSKIGIAMSVVGNTMTAISKKLVLNTAMWLVNTGAIKANTKELEKNGAVELGKNGQITSIKDFGKFMQGISGKGFSFMSLLKGIGTKIASIFSTIAKFIPQIAAIVAVIATITAIVFWTTQESRELKNLKEQANTSADAFQNIKQETSELKDNLDKLAEADTAFKTLVAGTAEFDQKLLETNELITDLIKKFPSLNDARFLSTDVNGLMHLNEAGRKEAERLQTEKQARAQAMSLLTAANYKRQQTKMSKEYQEAYHNENAGVAGRFRNLYQKRNQERIASEGLDTTKDVMDKVDAELRVSRKAAVSALLTSQKDLINKDDVAQIMGENYQAIIDGITADSSEKERAETYAQAYGYTHIAGNKFTNEKGEEIEVSKKVWNDEEYNKLLKANNQTIDSAQAVGQALSNLDSSAQEVFGNLKSNSLISDILSNNVETSRDDLAKLLDGNELSKLVSQMSESDIQALKAAGIEDAQTFIEERARAIQEIQKQQDSELAAMMARSSNLDTTDFEQNTYGAVKTIESIQNRLEKLDESQKKFLTNTSKGIEDTFGTKAMSSFMNTYLRGGEKTKSRLEQITKNIDWTSSISSLGAVNKMLNSTNEQIQKCGQSIKESANGSHLLNDAMQEMFASEDWQKLTENMDNYVNASGKLDASGIQKMSEESGTLSKMLDTGALTAGELAAAINATSIAGVADITDLSDAVIKLIGYFGHLDDAVWSAHNYIENFNEGIDFGEGEDFLKNNIEKIQEYLNPESGRIQWGNEQLHNYIQSVIGPEAWEKAVEGAGGNYKKAVKAVQKQVESFGKGYDQIFNNLGNGKTSTGKTINFDKINKELFGTAKDGIEFKTNKDGSVELELNGHSIKDLNQFLQKAEGVGENQANMMIEFWRAIAHDFDKDVRKQSFEAGLKDTSFVKDKTIGYQGKNGEKQNAVIISKSELKALASINEGKNQHQTKAQIQEYAGNAKVKTFQNMRNGELREDYKQMMKDWNEMLYGKDTQKQFINRGSFQNEDKTAVALDKLISQYSASGINQQQSLGMAYEAAKANKNKQYEYNGRIIDMSKIDSLGAFLEEISKIDENVHWVEIGESIAQGFFNYQKEKEKAEEAVKTGEIPENNAISGFIDLLTFGQGTNGSMQGKPPEGTTIPGVGFVPKEKDFTKDIETKFANFFDKFSGKDLLDGLTNGIFKIFNNNNNGNNKATKKEDTDTNGSQEAEESSKALAEIINKLSDAIGKAEEKINSFSNIFKIFSGKSNNSNKKTSDSSKSSPTIVPKIKGLTEKVTDFFKNDSFTKTIKVEGTDKVKEAGDKIKDIKKDTKTPSTLQVSAEVKKSKKQKKETITYVAKDKVVGEPGDIEKEIQYKAASKIKNEPDDLNKTIHYSADLPTVSDQWATLHLNLSENSKKFKVTPAAKGMNQYYSTDSLPNLGSLASGTKKGRVGPKGNGGLTLTGEEGYEVAWLPNEHRSMILGVNGPEMLNLPKNAVVWNHEQSKNIIKKNSIPSGSAAIGAGSCDSTADPYPVPGETKVTTKGKTSKSQNKSNSGKNGKKTEKILSQTWKLLKVAGKITNWWENISRKVEGAQRISDRNQKAFEKILNKAGSTLDDVKGVSANYQKSLKQIITLNQEIVTRYEKQLNNLTNGTGQNAESRNNAVSKINKAANNVTKAEAKLELARQTASKKDDKRAKKNLKKAKQRLKNAKKKNDKSAAIDTVTYEDTIYTKTRKRVNGKKKTVKKKKKVKSTRAVDWSKIIKYDEATDTWVLDENAINKAAGGNKKAAKAIKEKGNKLIDEKIQRRNAAQDKIDAARESLNKLADDTYNMFNRWEKSLTETYLISKKLETLQKTADIFKTQEEYISTKTTAGYRAPNALDQLTQVLASKQANLTQQVLANADLLTASFDAFEKSLNFDEYIDNYLVGKLKEGEIEGEGETARSQYEAASIAFGILREAGLDKLDTYDPEKARQAYEEYAAKNFTNGTDDEVVKVLDKIAEYQGNYLDAINETYGSVTEIYSALNEYEEYINDFEESLLKGLEEEINKEIEKQEKLNSALTNAFKNLLDEVKRRLDQRRQTEDNAKTESDIAKKQQRLATLRADTSGGHASEIAQLEQELAEAQQNYGRTLEDQLLERLQEQGDKAAEQRERQIALLEAERDLAQALGTNLEEVKEYLANGDYEKIRALWLENQGYDEALPGEREALERQFEAEWDKYKAYGEAASNLRDVLSKVNNPEEYQTSVTTALGSIQGLLNDIITKGIKQPEVKSSVTSAAEAKEKGLDASAALSALKATNENATYKDLASTYSAKEFKESGIDIKDALTAFTHEELKEGGYTAEDFKNANVDYGIAKGLFSSEQLVAAKYEEAIKEAKQSNYNQFLYNHGSADSKNKSKYKGKLSAESYKTQLERGKYLGYSEHKVAHDLATQKALNWKIVLQAIKAAGTAGPKTVKSWNPQAKTTSDFYKGYIAVFGKKKWDKYAKGGMNYTTGPAWLDGTRAKPEAVLNATETKNFIALKDILSDVMGHIDNTNSTTYGDSTWEININVDHLNNDYDVDKVAKRVEKIITDNANYRNVTMVRKFR